ncbi:MAG: type II toxin-antitoxin system HicB family antitoxin, partial [Microcystis aeruginosa]
ERLQENGQDYYVATSPDIQGLVAEADTIDAVIDIAKDLIPILLELATKDQLVITT